MCSIHRLYGIDKNRFKLRKENNRSMEVCYHKLRFAIIFEKVSFFYVPCLTQDSNTSSMVTKTAVFYDVEHYSMGEKSIYQRWHYNMQIDGEK